jgi:hypothetical protein
MIVNGYNLNTLALPTFSNLRATEGLQGVKGWRLVSRTKTQLGCLDIVVSDLFSNVSFANVIGR